MYCLSPVQAKKFMNGYFPSWFFYKHKEKE